MRTHRSLPAIRYGAAALTIVAAALLTLTPAAGWVSERRWPAGSAVLLQFNLGSSPRLDDGCPDWNCVGAAAVGSWNVFLDRLRLGWTTNPNVTKDARDRVNAVLFSDTVQGEGFNARTLAITVTYFTLSEQRLIEADVVFNKTYTWNSYRGALKRPTRDFRRVAIHEFGHAIGLEHPDEAGQTVTAIMNSTDSDVDDVVLDDIKGANALYGVAASGSAVPFPPRNETRDFRFALDAKYQQSLGRPMLDAFVDVEGAVVWTQEYLRYRLNGCTDEQARGRVRWQILGSLANDAAQPPVCGQAGSLLQFPPRNETLGFRQDLERIYRDELKRGTIRTAVDLEGDVVWIQEYVRYRLSGCGDGVATTKVFQQVDGQGVQRDCR